MKLQGQRLFLRLLLPADASPDYVGWLQNEQTNQFLESRWATHSLETAREYIEQVNQSPSDFLFGIFLIEGGRHIGNLKLSDIHCVHRFAHLGLIIGPSDLRGQGFGTEAIEVAVRGAFQEFNLQKVVAGLYVNNQGSHRAFLKAGFREVGRLEKHRFYKGDYVDEVVMEKRRDASHHN